MKKLIYLKEHNIWKIFQYELLSELENEFKIRNIKIGSDVEICSGAKIGSDAEIGSDTKIGKYNSFFADNLYKYSCGAWIEEKRGEIIQLGCFTRTRKEWEDDFWNNNDEFPNDNSDDSNARFRAFKICCYFLDLIKS